jgi:hypothetical protein
MCCLSSGSFSGLISPLSLAGASMMAESFATKIVKSFATALAFLSQVPCDQRLLMFVSYFCTMCILENEILEEKGVGERRTLGRG